MKILAALLLMVTLGFSKTYELLQDSSWASYQMVHPLKTVKSTSHDFYASAETVDDSRFDDSTPVILINIVADPKTFTCGIKFIDDYAMQIIEYHKHKDIKFSGYTLYKSNLGDNRYMVRGDLLFHGVKKTIEFPVKYEIRDGIVFVQGEFVVNILDFKLKRPKVMGIHINKELTVSFRLATKL